MPFTNLYVSKSVYLNDLYCKVGISNNVEKRCKEFNNGLRHRFKDCESVPVFEVFATIPNMKLSEAQLIEKRTLKKFSSQIDKRFGKEVFKISDDSKLEDIKNAMV